MTLTPIAAVIGEHTELKDMWFETIGFCPFCKTRHMTLAIDERRQLFHCFKCEAGGTAATFLKMLKDDQIWVVA